MRTRRGRRAGNDLVQQCPCPPPRHCVQRGTCDACMLLRRHTAATSGCRRCCRPLQRLPWALSWCALPAAGAPCHAGSPRGSVVLLGTLLGSLIRCQQGSLVGCEGAAKCTANGRVWCSNPAAAAPSGLPLGTPPNRELLPPAASNRLSLAALHASRLHRPLTQHRPLKPLKHHSALRSPTTQSSLAPLHAPLQPPQPAPPRLVT